MEVEPYRLFLILLFALNIMVEAVYDALYVLFER